MSTVKPDQAAATNGSRGHQVISDAQIGAAAMTAAPPPMFPKIPIPPAEVSMGISALDERSRQGTLRNHYNGNALKKV
jgi:hypothetical protein